MPAEKLYQRDSYLREFDAKVTRVENNEVFLDRTAFHPRPVGGLDADRGWLIVNDERVAVVDVYEKDGDVAHVVDDPSLFKPGVHVHGVIDWERRYRMMRLHTALHILAALLYEKHGARVTGSSISPEGGRADFDLSNVTDWKNALQEAVREANEIAKKCIEVRVYWLPREEAMRIPGLVKLAERMPPEVKQLRIVEIPGIDIQADEGPHVRNTCEIGEIVLEKMESKGRRRKRIYFNTKP
nr:alanyl-tRNA editing protein AlaXM [Pyrolobus fumarii]